MKEETSQEELDEVNTVNLISYILTNHAARVVIPYCEEKGFEGELFLIAAMKSFTNIIIEATKHVEDELAEEIIKNIYSQGMIAAIENRKKAKESEDE